jgi:hypothetical protein
MGRDRSVNDDRSPRAVGTRRWPAIQRPVGSRSSASPIVAVMLLLVLTWSNSAAAGDLAPPADEALSYDIAAQDLDAAIKSYIRISGTQVLFETAVTTGRRSHPLSGRFTAAQALENLLSGTGVKASRTDVDAFVIALDPARSLTVAAVPDQGFLAALQRGVLDVLCGDPLIRPGAYGVAIELWIAPDAMVQRIALIGSTRDPVRDRLLLDRLRGAAVGHAPPADLPQPIVVRIRPRSPLDTGDCAG